MLVLVWEKTWLSHINFAYGLAHYKVLCGPVEEQHPNDWGSNPNRDSRQVACFHFEFSLARSSRYFVSYDWMITLILALRHSIEKHSISLSLPIGHCDDRFTTFSWTALKQWKLITSWVPRMLALQPIRLFCSLSRCAPWETTHFKPGSSQSIVTWVRTTCLWFVFWRLPRLSMQPWVYTWK